MITGLAAIVARLSRTVLPMSLGGTLLLGAPAPSHVTSAPYAKHPFSAMEHAEYDVKYGPIRAGSGTLSVLGIDTVRGRDAYRFRMTLGGGVNLLLYKYALRDTMESWVDTATFTSLRFTQQQWHQGKLRSKHYEIFPERETYRDGTGAEQGSVANPLDDLSLFFFARTIPLTVGSSIDIPRHFKPASNPVVLKVVGRETIDAAGDNGIRSSSSRSSRRPRCSTTGRARLAFRRQHPRHRAAERQGVGRLDHDEAQELHARTLALRPATAHRMRMRRLSGGLALILCAACGSSTATTTDPNAPTSLTVRAPNGSATFAMKTGGTAPLTVVVRTADGTPIATPAFCNSRRVMPVL
jgi:hypothetical protein